MDYNTLTERIHQLCYKLEHNSFLTMEDREKLLDELNKLVQVRNKLLETLEKK